MDDKRGGVKDVCPCLFAAIGLAPPWYERLKFWKHCGDTGRDAVFVRHSTVAPRLPYFIPADVDNGDTPLYRSFTH